MAEWLQLNEETCQLAMLVYISRPVGALGGMGVREKKDGRQRVIVQQYTCNLYICTPRWARIWGKAVVSSSALHFGTQQSGDCTEYIRYAYDCHTQQKNNCKKEEREKEPESKQFQKIHATLNISSRRSSSQVEM